MARYEPGWSVVSIRHKLQSDGFQCAPWTHVALELFAAYFKAGTFGGFGDSFAKHDKLRPLDLVTSSSRGAKASATAINSAFIQGVRDEMRQALRDADAVGSMPFRPVVGHLEPKSPRAVAALQKQGHSAEDGIDAM